MLPEEIKNDNSKHEYRVLPQGETDIRHCIELWQREPDDHDIPMIRDEHGHVTQIGVYYGKWVNRTAWAKAQWDIILAENELIRLHQEQLKEMHKNKPADEIHRSKYGALHGQKIC